MKIDGSSFEIRTSRLPDASDIAFVHVSAWREAYSGLLPQKYLDELHYIYGQRKQMWHRFIQDERGRMLHVAELKGHGVVGFISMGFARDEQYEGWGEVTALYLLKRYHGLGVGRKLLEAGFKDLAYDSLSKAYCWVLSDNPTIGFYQRTGGVLTSHTKEDEIGGKKVTEVLVEWRELPER